MSGRTESHVMLVDLRSRGTTGKDAEAALGRAHITVNKNAIPNDPEKPSSPAASVRRLAGHDHARLRHGGGTPGGRADFRRAS